MRHGSLFSGIGGFDLASEWMGWTNVFHCEWEEFPRKVLNHHFPKSISYGDIKETDFTIHRGQIDILTGGFPCQPYSVAGKREGKNDDRHLWPEMLRAIREIKPRYVVGENVRGLLSWNGGLVFDEVQADLEDEGFEVIPFILPAASVNAPHKRDRVWFVAHANDQGGRGKLGDISKANGEISQRNEDAKPSNAGERDATHTDSIRLELSKETRDIREGKAEAQGEGSEPSNATEADGKKRNATNTTDDGRGGRQGQRGKERRQRMVSGEQEGRTMGSEAQGRSGERDDSHANIEGLEGETSQRVQEGQRGGFSLQNAESPGRSREDCGNGWEVFPTQPPVLCGDDGIPRKLDGITFPKWRKESIKAYGNAIVPQVVFPIFKSIQLHERAANTI